MSPSWRESLRVEIDAVEVRALRYSRGWRPRVLGQGAVPHGGATPAAVAEALGRVLAEVRGKPALAQVTLSNDWVQFALQEGASKLRGAQERAAAAAHALHRVYGAGAQDWRVCASAAGTDTLLAAGIERELYEQTLAVLDAADARLQTMRPWFAEAVNRSIRWLKQPTWFVAVEQRRAMVCFCDGNQLRSLRGQRLGDGLQASLPAWLAQSRFTDGHGHDDTGLVLAYRGAEPADPARWPFATRMVNLELAPGAAAVSP